MITIQKAEMHFVRSLLNVSITIPQTLRKCNNKTPDYLLKYFYIFKYFSYSRVDHRSYEHDHIIALASQRSNRHHWALVQSRAGP